MKKKNKTGKYFTTKSYLYLFATLLIIGFIIWYTLSWLSVKKEERLMTSYLVSSGTVTYEITDLNEINQVFQELPTDYFVYISYENDEDIYKLEKGLKKAIDNYGLKDVFYYINISDIKESETLITDLNDSFNTTKIKYTPCLLYYKNGQFEDILQLKDGLFTYQEFINLLKNYEYELISQ